MCIYSPAKKNQVTNYGYICYNDISVMYMVD